MSATLSSPSHSEARVFLDALFARKLEDLYLLLWTLSDKQSHWFQHVDDAIRFAQSAAQCDLYVGTGMSKRDYGPFHRCPSNEIAGISAIWADLDLCSDAHPKSTLPRTIQQALAIPPPEISPSFVISTGNGIHLWWLFREPYIFEDDEDGSGTAMLLSRWHTLLRDNASQQGWTYERLADLARLLRVPGTTNCKDPSNSKPVVIHSQTDLRYKLSDFAEYLDAMEVPDEDAAARMSQECSERIGSTPLVINISARVAEDRLTRWLDSNPRFKNTWFRQRSDLTDQSQSGYDLALACFGLDAGCTEQEVVDLIVHHRAFHRQKLRTRVDYFQRTLAKAASRSIERNRLHGTSADAPLDAGTQDKNVEQPFSGTQQNHTRAKINLCHEISRIFGVEVLRLVKLTGKDPLYRMELAEGKIEFPSVAKFISQESVRLAIAGTVGKLIDRIKPKQWQEVAQMLLSACIEEQGGEELQYDGAARMYVDQYLAETPFAMSQDLEIPQNSRKPLIRDGRITVCAVDLQLYINKTTLQNLNVRAAAAMLSAVGAKAMRVRVRKSREQSRWELPLEEFDPSAYAIPEPETSV